MVFYYQEKEGSGQPTHSFYLKLADQELLFFPKSKTFYIVAISFQPSLLEEEICNHYIWYKYLHDVIRKNKMKLTYLDWVTIF